MSITSPLIYSFLVRDLWFHFSEDGTGKWNGDVTGV